MSPLELPGNDRDLELRKLAAILAAEVLATATHTAMNLSAAAAQVTAESPRIDLQYIKADLKEIKERLDSKLVSVETFTLRIKPLERLVYSTVALFLLSVMGGIIALVIKR